jgi:hypothetical protein
MNQACKTLIRAFVAFVILFVPVAASAQFPALAVVPGDVGSAQSEQFWMDVVEESAFLAEDFGVYTVSRYYEMETMMDPQLASVVLDCGPSAQCVADMLYGTPYSFALHVSINPVPAGTAVTYRLVDVQMGTVSGEATAVMSTPQDFGSLQQPCFQALRGEMVAQPNLSAPPAVATPGTAYPGNNGQAGPGTEPYVPDQARTPRETSSMTRAGRLTATAGGVLLATGLLIGYAADDTLQTIQSEPHESGELESLQTTGRNQQRLANICFALGGTALATGITLAIVDRSNANRSTASPGFSMQLRANPVGRWVGVGGRF